MKKPGLIITIIGLGIQVFGLGFMLYGVNNNESLYWTGTMIQIIGFILIAVGLIIYYGKSKQK